MDTTLFTLTDPATGNLALKAEILTNLGAFDHLQRLNHYLVILVRRGEGTLKADFADYSFFGPVMLCFSPYQPFLIKDPTIVEGLVLHFHSDFFCIYKHQKEVACQGVLFNNLYHQPVTSLRSDAYDEFAGLIGQMHEEARVTDLAQRELLVSFLKIFLIKASRIRVDQIAHTEAFQTQGDEPTIIQRLRDALETYYREKHSARDYGELLNISPKALTKVTKAHFDKTVSDLIAGRLVVEAKRELYLTHKSVREIAYELGFGDEHYFSRFFKNNAKVSPQHYRETVGWGRNLST